MHLLIRYKTISLRLECEFHSGVEMISFVDKDFIKDNTSVY